MWGQAEISSDHDLFCVYQTPAKEYMVTGNFNPTRAATPHVMIGGKEFDFQYMEIGHLMGLLMKGNINALWAVCSPIVWKDSEALKTLKEMSLRHLATSCYPSIKGMAISQWRDADKRKDVRPPEKSRVTCRRTLEFGSNLLLGGGVDFFSAKIEVSDSDCQDSFERLDYALLNSKLPERVSEEPFKRYLYGLRMIEVLENRARWSFKPYDEG